MLTSNWEVSTGHLHYSIIIFTNLHKLSSSVRLMMILKQILQLESIPWVFCMIFRRDCLQRFVSMLHLCVFIDFLHFVVLSKIYGVERERCDSLSRIQQWITYQSWQTGPIQSVLRFEVVFVVFWRQIGKLIQVVCHYTFIIFTQITQKFLITWFIDDIETNLPIGKHT